MVETAQECGAELDLEDPNVQAYLESSQYKQVVGRQMVETAQKDGAELGLEDPDVQAYLKHGSVMVKDGRTKFKTGN